MNIAKPVAAVEPAKGEPPLPYQKNHHKRTCSVPGKSLAGFPWNIYYRRAYCSTCSHWISNVPLVRKLDKSHLEHYRLQKLGYKICISDSTRCKNCSIIAGRSYHFHARECRPRTDVEVTTFFLGGVNFEHAKYDFWPSFLHLVNVDCCLEKTALPGMDAHPYTCRSF